MWSQAVVDVVNRNFAEVNLVSSDVSKYLASGFFWHTPDTAHLHVTDSMIWWEHHYKIFEHAITNVTNLSGTCVQQILTQIRQEFLDPSSWTVFPEVTCCLSELSSIGWKHIILSNHVPELSDLIENLGLLNSFETIVTSAEIGYEKPNRMAFDWVTRSLPGNSKIWMIGDNYSADVLGANNVKLGAILVRNKNEHAEHFAETLNEVRCILELN